MSSSPHTPRNKFTLVDACRSLWSILRLSRVSLVGREARLSLLLVVLLFVRTRLTVRMADVVSMSAKRLVERDMRKFVLAVTDIGVWSMPSALVNAGITYLTAVLQQFLRQRVQRALHEKYFSHAFLGTTQALHGIEHRHTRDVLQMCVKLVDFLPSALKPTFDIVTLVWMLSKHGGVRPPLLLISYYIAASLLLHRTLPNFAGLNARTEELEGDFRTAHATVVRHAEEVAFYHGEETERRLAQTRLRRLSHHHRHLAALRLRSDAMDAALVKYFATCVGYAVCAIGVFERFGKVSASELTRIYIGSSQMYIPLARAVGRLLLLHVQLSALLGATARVAEMVDAIQRVANDARKGTVVEVPRSSTIALHRLTLDAHSGQRLLQNVSFHLRCTDHLLVVGNNGSGKSCLIRAIRGTMRATEGNVARPPMGQVYVLPQRSFLPKGTLRGLLLYPTCEKDSPVTDEELIHFLQLVGLAGLLHPDGLDGQRGWQEVLSGGERQRVGVVRVLVHRPTFALLDESTAAVSQDMEPTLLGLLKTRGVTLITVSHRVGLTPHHKFRLTLDGLGGHTMEECGAS